MSTLGERVRDQTIKNLKELVKAHEDLARDFIAAKECECYYSMGQVKHTCHRCMFEQLLEGAQ